MTTSSPLDPQQQRDLLAAEEGLKQFMGATAVATFNGWALGGGAALTLAIGLGSVENLITGLAVGVMARNEFKGRNLLRAIDPAGLNLLWRNQVGLIALAAVYCVWAMSNAIFSPSPELAQITALLGEGSDEFMTDLIFSVYGSVLVLVCLFQGMNARYYHARVGRLATYLAETPSWIVDIHRARASK